MFFVFYHSGYCQKLFSSFFFFYSLRILQSNPTGDTFTKLKHISFNSMNTRGFDRIQPRDMHELNPFLPCLKLALLLQHTFISLVSYDICNEIKFAGHIRSFHSLWDICVIELRNTYIIITKNKNK